MNISSATSGGVAIALQSVQTDSDLAMTMLQKAMENQQMEGAAALQLIQATGKGGQVNFQA